MKLPLNWNDKTKFLACNNLVGTINLIVKNLGFYKLLAWPISVVSMVMICFLNCFGHRFTDQEVCKLLEDYHQLYKY